MSEKEEEGIAEQLLANLMKRAQVLQIAEHEQAIVDKWHKQVGKNVNVVYLDDQISDETQELTDEETISTAAEEEGVVDDD